MKISIAQLDYHIGNFDSNVRKIREAIRQARDESADLILFAELAVCGYPPGDFLEFDDFIHECELAIHSIAQECEGIAAIVGAPSVNPNPKGKRLFNTAYFLAEGKVMALTHKSLLPNYDVFDEYRYFEPNRELSVIEYRGTRIALTICEDLWNLTDTPLYTASPMEMLIRQRPDLVINIGASPFHYSQAGIRREVLIRNASAYGLPVFFVNHIGAQTELIFDGGSMVVDRYGKVLDELNYFQEDLRFYHFEEKNKEVRCDDRGIMGPQNLDTSPIALINDALVLGIRTYFRKLGFQDAILGLSGGLDSAVTLVLAAEALGREHVHAVLLPSRYSTDHSIQDAVALAHRTGVPYQTLSIEEIFKSVKSTLLPVFDDLPADVTEENIQARIRAVLLMALANKFGYILLNTSNKSEAAVGYGTLYGDMCGGISVLGDVYKTQVYKLARYMNRADEIIPWHTIHKPPSAELKPDQKDSDSLPPYDVLDKILFQYIELRQGPQDIISMGFDEGVVRKVLRLVNLNEYKRHQTPPILRISPKAFGMGRRMPIAARYLY
ncbi:MAG: NAD+ synthase [Bacteroidales bacterium]|nr:NAD+ synthase [Lentimicrobiaceae bacterium]MDD5695949.1 NAD+ synthase [Bacteroidales bacterium]